MKHTKHLLATSLIAICASLPVMAAKIDTDTSLAICAEALVNDMAADQNEKMSYKLDPKSKGFSGTIKRTETIYLDAKTPESQEVIARYNCVINRDAEVEELIELPIDAPSAEYRASR